MSRYIDADMNDYIKREDALRAFNGIYSTVDADDILRHLHKSIDVIKNIPAADVRENVRGEWQITDAYPHNVYCSVCHAKVAQTHWSVWEDGSLPRNFCPNCGADMRGDNNEY